MKDPNLASEKFVFQKATKNVSPQRREFQSKMSIKSSPFDQFEAEQASKAGGQPMAKFSMPAGGGK